jgi:diaminohydroxyphosphoribosylaminopyrimidine deaminase/5-amino-6-(5-phosphoribosylamino)uracil reductase
MTSDETHMRRALALAEQGRYTTSPNPMVGCVIARGETMIAEGWHRRAGEAHAEIDALQRCDDPRGATMYVTLEPCAHHGRTGPCAEAVIAAGVARVVIAVEDPHEIVNGRGIELLRAAGIEVTVGVLESEARRLNEKFVWSVTRKLPFVLIKAAMTLDGKLATVTRDSQWITTEASRERSLLLREEYDAILVGSGTVKADNPRLTRRMNLAGERPWTRIVLDAEREVPPHAQVLNDGGETIHHTQPTDLAQVFGELYARGIQSVIVEGGSLVHAEVIRRGLWQKMVLFIAPMIVGGANAPSIFSGDPVSRLTDAYRFRFDRAEFVGSDVMVTAYPVI